MANNKSGNRTINNKRNRVLVVGSVAFDLIFGIHGKIQDEILIENGELGRQNLMFVAKDRKQFFGGTGGNISYGLGRLGDKPILFSVVGKDFIGEYSNHMKKNGIESRLKIIKDQWTATFFGMSDEESQQIGVYQPNAYSAIETSSIFDTILKKNISQVTIAIFSAGTGKSIYKHMRELREERGKDVTIIFDPGQVISIFYDKKLLEDTLELCDIFIGNEIEFKQLESILGYSHEMLLKKNLRAVIKTVGERGSIVYNHDGEVKVPVEKVSKIVETTGAGDAYRAGLIHGLLKGYSIEKSCRIGAYLGARSVETFGGQSYQIELKEISKI